MRAFIGLSGLVSGILVLGACGAGDGGGLSNLPPAPTDTVVPTDPGPVPTNPGPTDPVATDAPIAVCSVSESTVLPFYETVAFDGSASYDPAGVAITEYRWVLSEAPTGSSAVMPPGTAVRSGFTTDQAGLYVGRLTVVNAAGLESAACEAMIEAVPAESFWIEMFWDQPGDDMDLHLLAPGGTIGTPTDCYYGNCKPTQTRLDWGQQGFQDDDPTLDRDDLAGMGPENINILSPAPGVYTIVVKDFGIDTDIANTQVTVNVYIDGALTWTDVRTVVGDPTDPIYFAEISWPSGLITEL